MASLLLGALAVVFTIGAAVLYVGGLPFFSVYKVVLLIIWSCILLVTVLAVSNICSTIEEGDFYALANVYIKTEQITYLK